MLSPYEPLQCVFEVPGEAGFAMFGVAVKGDPDRIFEADVLADHASVLHHGDILLVTSRASRHGPHASMPDAHVAAMVHKDRDGRVTLTKLLELPHDPESLRALLAGMPAALRQGREGAPTETQPKRQRVVPERTRIADGPRGSLVRQAVAEGRDGALAERRDSDEQDTAGTTEDRPHPDAAEAVPRADNVADEPATNRRASGRRGGMNLR